MALKLMVLAFGMVVASPLSATTPGDRPESEAPVASADGTYCLHVENVTGSRIETIQCWTREEWAAQEVDLDAEWPKEGVVLTQ